MQVKHFILYKTATYIKQYIAMILVTTLYFKKILNNKYYNICYISEYIIYYTLALIYLSRNTIPSTVVPLYSFI